MKMPNGDAAIVDRQKLPGHWLNAEHPRGEHKARVFATLGFTAETPTRLRAALLIAARQRRRAAGGIGPIRRSLSAGVCDRRSSKVHREKGIVRVRAPPQGLLHQPVSPLTHILSAS
jgi:hypothetical protein